MSHANKTGIFIIMGYENSELTQSCLNSFLKFLPTKYSIALYDDGSETPLASSMKMGRAEYVRSENNLGFAAGCNYVSEKFYSKYDFLCLVNNDITIDKQFGSLVEDEIDSFFADSKLAAFSPQLFLDEKHTLVENFGILYFRSGLVKQNTHSAASNVLLNGAFLFLKSSAINITMASTGYLMNPYFEFNGEDVDLSLRILASGLRIKVSSVLKAQHARNQSLKKISKKSQMLYWRNLRMIFWSTRSSGQLVIDLPFNIAGEVLWIGYAILHGLLPAYLNSVKSFFSSKQEVKKMRLVFQSLDASKTKPYIRNGIC